MLRSILLATSMLVAAPVFAQDKPMTPESQPAQNVPATTAEAAPAKTAPNAGPVQQATPAPNAQAAQPTPDAPAQAAAQPAPTTEPATAVTAAQPAPAAQPAASQDQVAQAVTRDFGSYDKDANGALSAAEFGSWMSTLRKASEPNFVPGSAEAKAWESQAFTSADADKNAAINQQELTTFLTPKPS